MEPSRPRQRPIAANDSEAARKSIAFRALEFKRARRSKSFLAAEAIAAFVEAEGWQHDEMQAGLADLDAGRGVSHKDVSAWLRSWGSPRERKAPRG